MKNIVFNIWCLKYFFFNHTILLKSFQENVFFKCVKILFVLIIEHVDVFKKKKSGVMYVKYFIHFYG